MAIVRFNAYAPTDMSASTTDIWLAVMANPDATEEASGLLTLSYTSDSVEDTAISPTKMALDYDTIVLKGEGFTYNAAAGFTAGTIEAIDYNLAEPSLVAITGLAFDAADFSAYAASGDYSGLLTDLFSGNDIFHGSQVNVDAEDEASLGDYIFAAAGNDTMNGNGGNDILVGGTGADKMRGGDGDDRYSVDNQGDKITENSGEGTDSVTSSVSLTLSANVESLTLTGTGDLYGYGNSRANTLVGNDGVNILRGYGGKDVLNGGYDADTLLGGRGDDVYYVDNEDDRVVELASEGSDSVFSTVSHTLGATLEHLTLSGYSDVDGTGNDKDNWLVGNTGINTLTGGDGDDVLDGGYDEDQLTGGDGEDVFHFASASNGQDTITDFSAGQGDQLAFSSANFGELKTGILADNRFASNATGVASTTKQRFIFNTANGILYYDADGTGDDSAVALATLTGITSLSAGDLLITAS